jgi:hypothetical protein
MFNGMRTGRRALSGLGALGISMAVLVAPGAAADPVDSAEPVPQVVVDVSPAPEAVAATPVPAPASTAQADGVPHLPSPDNLPPGTTQAAPEGPKMSYLRYLWQAVHTPGVTMGDALMLIAQRPMDAKSEPPSSPTGPVTPAAEPVTGSPASP